MRASKRVVLSRRCEYARIITMYLHSIDVSNCVAPCHACLSMPNQVLRGADPSPISQQHDGGLKEQPAASCCCSANSHWADKQSRAHKLERKEHWPAGRVIDSAQSLDITLSVLQDSQYQIINRPTNLPRKGVPLHPTLPSIIHCPINYYSPIHELSFRLTLQAQNASFFHISPISEPSLHLSTSLDHTPLPPWMN